MVFFFPTQTKLGIVRVSWFPVASAAVFPSSVFTFITSVLAQRTIASCFLVQMWVGAAEGHHIH